MSFFPLAFAGVIACGHAYLMLNLWRAFPLGKWHILTALLLGALFAGVWYRGRLAAALGPTFSDAVFLWVGFLLLVTPFTAGREALHIAAWCLDKLAATEWARHLATAKSVRVALGVGLLAFGYGLFEASQIRVRTLTVKTDRLPEGVEKLRIVAATDLHLTKWTSDAHLARAVDLINAQRPDIAVLLGDTVDDHIVDEEKLWRKLGEVSARLGKLAIVGNHEYYRDLRQAIEFHDRAGFTMLRGTCVDIGGIRVAGVDDPAVRRQSGQTMAQALPPEDNGKFVLLLAHRPETPEEVRGLFDLQISGHTHGGQLWPGRYLTRLDSGYWQGLTVLPPVVGRQRESLLYLSNGTGYWGPPVRFLTPPEITVIDVESVGR